MIRWVQVLPLTSCIALRESFNTHVPGFPHIGTYFTGLLEGLAVLYRGLMMEKKGKMRSGKEN